MRKAFANPAFVVSLVSLAFAMTGTGIATKSMITGNQIKDKSITAKDIADGAITAKKLKKGAVKSRNVAPGAITSSALAPDSVTSSALAPNSVTAGEIAPEAVTESAIRPGAVTAQNFGYTICPNGYVVPPATPCPALPWGQAAVGAVTLKSSGLPGIYWTGDLQFNPALSSGVGMWNAGNPKQLSVPTRALYDISFKVNWNSGAGSLRQVTFSRKIGSGIHKGESVNLGPETSTDTSEFVQSMNRTVCLDKDDTLTFTAIADDNVGISEAQAYAKYVYGSETCVPLGFE